MSSRYTCHDPGFGPNTVRGVSPGNLEDINQLYMKYIIEIIYKNRSYYTLWGEDENGDNQLLINESKNVFFFNAPTHP